MSDLVCGYPMDDFNIAVTDYLKGNKVDDYTLDDLKGVFYTDGGSRIVNSINYGGWGVHGYLFVDKTTSSNSECKKAVPTTEGYVVGKISDKQSKAYVVSYLDYYGTLESNSTNNKAELLGMLRCLYLIDRLGLKESTIYADSKYVLGTIENKEIYKQNGFKASSGKDLANQEMCMSLIEMFDEVCDKYKVHLKWVKGHNGNYGNECADANATKGCFIASNKIKKVVINTDDDVTNDYNTDGDYFSIGTPDSYFGKEHEAPKMLSENSLFFTTNGIDVRDNTTYYQASFGKSLGGKDKHERKMLRGKPFSDCCISVVNLNTSDAVTNNIMNIVADNFPSTGVVECNLSYQTRQAVYSELLNGGLNNVSVDINKNQILMPNKEELATLADPVRQSFRLINDFNTVKQFLDYYVKQDGYGIDSILDITDRLYNIKETKNKTVYKVLEFAEGVINVPMDITVAGINKTIDIPVSIGVDTPSRVSLGRMKSIEPKVSLVTFDTEVRTLRFATIIETTEGIGVWMGIYSNTCLH